jgi:hypothetical protein
MDRFKVKITKLSKNETKVRTDSMEGWCYAPPKEGSPFQVFGKPLDPDLAGRSDAFRWLSTSKVQSVSNELGSNECVIITMNSTYQVEFLGLMPDEEY